MDVSIIVVTYNHVRYLRDCIESIIAQQGPYSFEIIIGEDGSTDGTRELAIELSQQYSKQIRLRLQNRENVIYIDGHPTGRFNVIDCMASAKGRYICFCEGDDYWISNNKLEKQIQLLDQNPDCGGSYHETLIVAEDQLTDKAFRSSLPSRLTFADTIGEISAFHTSSFMMRTEHLAFPKFIKKITSFDMYLFTLAASHGDLLLCDQIQSAYRKHAGGITSNPDLIKNYHKRRAFLMRQMKSYFKQSPEKFDAIIQKHEAQLDSKGQSLLNRILHRIKRFKN